MSPKDSDFVTEAHIRAEEKKSHVSFPQLKYPSLRDENAKDPAKWLEGKKLDDGAEGLWRVHDSLYDLTQFVDKHPGGRDWLDLSKGTDITEAFESHHLSKSVETLLKKYYVRNATTPRNSPFTFEENGFYKTFKVLAGEKLKKLPKTVFTESNKITDSILLTLLVSSVISCWCISPWLKIIPILAASLSLCWLTVCAHNYIHRKDNWRMYLFNLSMGSYRDFRISHALSHHQYPNTLLDWEVSALEPVFPWLPRRKNKLYAKFAFIVQLATFPFMFFGVFLQKVILVLTRKGYFEKHWHWHDLIGFFLPTWMWLISRTPASEVLTGWVIIMMLASLFFLCIGVNAAHHHPDIFHDGDQANSATVDFGLHQLAAVMDRADITGSRFLVLTHFGDHALHHLLPTVDHGALAHLYPAFLQHCRRHGANFRITTQKELVLGQIRQMNKTEPTLLS